MSVLRDPSGGMRWDFDRAFREAGLEPPWPRNISFGDIDAEATEVGFEPDAEEPLTAFETEMSGQFLVVEGKRDGEGLSLGQRKTMDARLHTGRTCVVVYGEPPTDIHRMQVWGCDPYDAGVRDFWEFCHAWAIWAANQPFHGELNAFVTAVIGTFVEPLAQRHLPDGWRVRPLHNRDDSWTVFVDDAAGDYTGSFAHGQTKDRAVELAVRYALRKIEQSSVRTAPETSAQSNATFDPFADLDVDWPA